MHFRSWEGVVVGRGVEWLVERAEEFVQAKCSGRLDWRGAGRHRE